MFTLKFFNVFPAVKNFSTSMARRLNVVNARESRNGGRDSRVQYADFLTTDVGNNK